MLNKNGAGFIVRNNGEVYKLDAKGNLTYQGNKSVGKRGGSSKKAKTATKKVASKRKG